MPGKVTARLAPSLLTSHEEAENADTPRRISSGFRGKGMPRPPVKPGGLGFGIEAGSAARARLKRCDLLRNRAALSEPRLGWRLTRQPRHAPPAPPPRAPAPAGAAVYPGMLSGASQNAYHLCFSSTSGVTSMPRLENAFAWSFDMRLTPVVTRYSGVRFCPSIAHSPPPRRTDKSRIVGVPPTMANRARSCEVPCPFHATVSWSPSTRRGETGGWLCIASGYNSKGRLPESCAITFRRRSGKWD